MYLLVDQSEEVLFIHENNVWSYKYLKHDNGSVCVIMLSALCCVMDVPAYSFYVFSMFYLKTSISLNIERLIFDLISWHPISKL